MNSFVHIDFWEMSLRGISSFFILLLFARIIGKKQLSQLTFFNYIAGITIGSIAADISSESQTPFFNGLISLVWWVLLTIFLGYINKKSSVIRVLSDGQPTILIKDGKILRDSLKVSRLNLDDLSMMLREKDVFSLQDVHYAILEPNGKISVLKKESEQTVTRADLNIPTPSIVHLPTEIISDGKIVKKNLTELHMTEKWVIEELQKQGIASVEEVFYAETQKDGSLFVNLY